MRRTLTAGALLLALVAAGCSSDHGADHSSGAATGDEMADHDMTDGEKDGGEKAGGDGESAGDEMADHDMSGDAADEMSGDMSGGMSGGDMSGEDGHGGGSHSHENSPVAEGARTIEVRGTSYAFTPNRLTAEAGEDLAIRLTSADIEHDLVVEGTEGHVYAAAGETAVGGLTAPAPGTYVIYCSIDGHRESGMEGVLTVS